MTNFLVALTMLFIGMCIGIRIVSFINAYKNPWNDVNDRLPSKPGKYLVILDVESLDHRYNVESYLYPPREMSAWYLGEPCFASDIIGNKVTHWMSIPEIPISS